MRALAASDGLATAAALTGRFYGEGLRWALALPVPDLIRWATLMEHVKTVEGPAPVMVYRPR